MASKTSLLLLKKINLLLLALIYHRKKRLKQQQKGMMWVRKIFTERRTKGELNILLKDLMLFDSGCCGCCIIAIIVDVVIAAVVVPVTVGVGKNVQA